MKAYVLYLLVLLGLLTANGACRSNEQNKTEQTTTGVQQQPSQSRHRHHHHRHSESTNSQASTPTAAVPDYVRTVLAYVQKNHRAPDGYVGGRTFGNFEKRLPNQNSAGLRLRYQEWDVKPKVQGQNRGAERLITSSDDHAYYTSDHYRTFTEIE